jgi:hypothetical protein
MPDDHHVIGATHKIKRLPDPVPEVANLPKTPRVSGKGACKHQAETALPGRSWVGGCGCCGCGCPWVSAVVGMRLGLTQPVMPLQCALGNANTSQCGGGLVRVQDSRRYLLERIYAGILAGPAIPSHRPRPSHKFHKLCPGRFLPPAYGAPRGRGVKGTGKSDDGIHIIYHALRTHTHTCTHTHHHHYHVLIPQHSMPITPLPLLNLGAPPTLLKQHAEVDSLKKTFWCEFV